MCGGGAHCVGDWVSVTQMVGEKESESLIAYSQSVHIVRREVWKGKEEIFLE